MRSRTHKVARNASFLVASQVASTALSVVLTAVLARWFGAVEYGVYYMLVVVTTFAYVFVDWGQSAYLISESARRPEKDRQLLGGAMAFRVAATVVVALATVAVVKMLGYPPRIELLALFAVVCGLPFALSQAYAYMFRGRDRMDLDATVTVTLKALTVAVTLPVVFLGGGLPTVILIQAVAGAGALLVAVKLSRGIHLKAQRPDGEILKELASSGGPIAIFFIAVAVQPFIDIIVLSKLVPPEVVGWYAAARNIMGLLLAPANILASASFPELSRVSGSLPDLCRALRASLRPLLGIGALAAAGTFLFADVAVELIYGHGHFDPAAPVLQCFAAILPLLFMGMLFGTALTAARKTTEIAIAKVLSVVMSTFLSILFIPLCQARWGNGGIGLVLAFGVSEILMTIGYVWLLPRGAVDRGALLHLLRAAVAVGGTVAIIWFLPSMKPWEAVPACVAVFMVLTLASGLLLRTDLEKVIAFVWRKV